MEGEFTFWFTAIALLVVCLIIAVLHKPRDMRTASDLEDRNGSLSSRR